MVWPRYFPDGCPPAGAQPADGTVFRFTKEEVPQASDFVPHAAVGRVGDNPCQSSGVSVLREEGDIDRLRSICRWLRKKWVARGVLRADLGCMTSTPLPEVKSHHTWWIPEGVQPAQAFGKFRGPGMEVKS